MIGGAAALSGLFVVGAVVQVPRTETDLTVRVESKLAMAGVEVRADFSGQDGTLYCTTPFTDPVRAVNLARSVWGVRSIETDGSCGIPAAMGSASTTSSSAPPTSNRVVESTVPTTAPPTTTPSTTAPSTTAPSTTAPPTTLPAATPLFTATLQNGRLILDGVVAGDLERLALINGARDALTASNVVNNLTVDPQVGAVPAPQFSGLLDLLALMPTNMVGGALGWNGSDVGLVGSYASDDARAVIETAAAQAGVAATLTLRATATAEQAAALEAELNALVSVQPILFDKGSINVSLSSLGTVQQVAGIAKRYGGLIIEVQGHTDSEGDPDRNMTLSEQRAASVRDALIAMGAPAADLTSRGFGMTQLIRDSNGNELPDTSRRVVFGVTLI